jgi:dTDP-4-dehydrorhamnose 3,5-epimerase
MLDNHSDGTAFATALHGESVVYKRDTRVPAGGWLRLVAEAQRRSLTVLSGEIVVLSGGAAIPLNGGETLDLAGGQGVVVANKSESDAQLLDTGFSLSADAGAKASVEWLQTIPFDVRPLGQLSIDGAVSRDLTVHLDGRGEVTELWSEPWNDLGFLTPSHVYQSGTDHGVVKCWHLHVHHTDQFAITRGKVQVILADVRTTSPTFGHVNSVVLGSLKPGLIKIPPGVMHGWKALSGPEIIVFNLQSHVYSGVDEYKFPWDSVLSHVWEPRNG